MTKVRINLMLILLLAVLCLPAAGKTFSAAAAAPERQDAPSSMGRTEYVGRAEGTVSGRAYIDLVYQNKSYRYADKLIEAPDHLVAEEIFVRKINAPQDEKLRLVEKCLNAGADYKTAVLRCYPRLARTVARAASEIDREPSDSDIRFQPDASPMFYISREKDGLKLDEQAVYRDIYYAWRRGKTKVTLNPSVVRAAVTVFDNIALTKKRGAFSTDYSASTDERKHNIRLALSKINGKVLLPGEEFSFNAVVGRRTEKNGFKEAKIIKGGEYVEGFGGGVCQASTTVYNAALLSDLEIVMANRHSLESSYVSPSFDAMVNSGWSDLKFKNSTEGKIFLRAYGDDTGAHVEIYGVKNPFRIVRKSEIVKREDPPQEKEIVDTDRKYVTDETPSGARVRVSYSKGALESRGFLLYYDEKGRLVERREIRHDKYFSMVGIVAVAP